MNKITNAKTFGATAKTIKGVPTEAAKARARARARAAAKGPKPGAARSNQTAKLADTEAKATKFVADYKASKLATRPDVIKEVKGTADGRYIAVKAGDNTLTYPVALAGGGKELAKLAAVGASFKALQNWLKTHKPEAKLATGLNGHSAPQSAMAAAESRKSGNGSSTASATSGSAKAAKKAAHTTSKGDFTYVVGKANDTRADTWTYHMVTIIQSVTDTATARAKHDKSGRYVGKKLDFTWAKAKGFIK